MSPPGSPNTQDYFEYVELSPMSHEHPPSLKNPKHVPYPTAQDGWHKGDAPAKKKQAVADLKEIHKRTLHQIGRPNVAIGAPVPTFPSIVDYT